jgi:hypothetical protein
MGVSGQRHAPAALYPRGKDSRYPFDRKLVGPRAGLDAGARRNILCPCQESNSARPARSQTLYCLSYRGSTKTIIQVLNTQIKNQVIINIALLSVIVYISVIA